MEIIGTIRYVDLDTKIGRIRKRGGTYVTASFKNFTHSEITEAFKGDNISFSLSKEGKGFIVECIGTQ